MISVIIPTLNRNNKIILCLKSLVTQITAPTEIIVLDQNIRTWSSLTHYIHAHSRIIKYIKSNSRNKSIALNRAIASASGEFLAFTDDDCMVDPMWLTNITHTFKTNKSISGVFGRTLPYHPGASAKKICPSCFNPGDKSYIITKPAKHWEIIGFGNNMAFRREIFDTLGSFKSWLGPGSVGSTAEDAEFALRVLTRGYTLLYNPKMVVYHNKWLTPEEMKTQQLSYSCGEMACYTYYSLSGYDFAKTVIKNNAIWSFYDFRQLFGEIIKRGVVKSDEWKYSVIKFYTRLKGYFFGMYYYMKEVKLQNKIAC